jgi:predicted enzyme related to lactoylglutathione lyase
MQINYIRLLVDNFSDCFDFYSELIGFEVTWGKRDEDYASFQVNSVTMLSLYKRKSMYDHLGINEVKGGPKLVIPIACTDVDVEYERLVGLKQVFIKEPHDVPGWGDRCAHLYDPDGNIIELNQLLEKDKWDKELLAHQDAHTVMNKLK